MIIENYRELISNDVNLIDFVRIYDVFNHFNEYEDINEGKKYLVSEQIDKVIKKLCGKFRVQKIKYIYSAVSSLKSNISSFISSSSNNGSIIQKRKLLLSYINFELSSVSYLDINNMLSMTQEERIAENHKVILVLGGTDLIEDDINTAKEINMIRKTFVNTNYHVISYIGCTIDIFRAFVSKYEFECFHFAGHGTPDGKLCFYKSNAKASTIEKIFTSNNRVAELNFFNNCYSYSFYTQLSSRIANNSIVYDGNLSSVKAYNFSETYYGAFVVNDSTSGSFNSAQMNCANPLYRYL